MVNGRPESPTQKARLQTRGQRRGYYQQRGDSGEDTTNSWDTIITADTIATSVVDMSFEEGVASGSIDSLLDSSYLAAAYYKMQKDLYRIISVLADSMAIDSINDSILVNFYATNKNGSIGVFDAIGQAALGFGDTSLLNDSVAVFALRDSLLAMNSSVSSEVPVKDNEQKMNSIALNFPVADSGVTNTQKSLILGLAYSCPFTAGEAVYVARAYYAAVFNDDSTYFDDDSICAGRGTRMARLTSPATADSGAVQNDTKKSILIFPNPAKDIIYVVTSLESNEIGVLDIYNVAGIRMTEIRISGGLSTSTLSVSGLANGVYTYRLLTNKEFIDDGKLVIIK